VQYRLLESGLIFEQASSKNSQEAAVGGKGESTAAQNLSEVTEKLGEFVRDLNNTGCYDSVQVMLGRSATPVEDSRGGQEGSSITPLRQIEVILKEKNWYKLYIGGGIKNNAGGVTSNSGGSMGMLPKVQFETTAGLLNLTGHCDTTNLSYTIDQTSIPTFMASHTRPLYACLRNSSPLREFFLGLDQGSKIGCTIRGQVDTVDYEHIRSCRDHIQQIGIRLANTADGSGTGGGAGGPTEGIYVGVDWTLTHRDIIPRRHISVPYLCDASPEIVSSSGPTLKHSVVSEYKLNGAYVDDRFNPTQGIDSYAGIEVAGPPGNVGFVKCWGGGALHWPIVPTVSGPEKKRIGLLKYALEGLSFHSSLHFGLIKQLTFGGLLPNDVTNIADRFYVGGPHQLRGFLPAGIGPRAETGGASTPGGDSMGGDAFYTGTAAVSIPFPGITFLAKNRARLFGFANIGTLSGLDAAINVNSFMNSSRVALGGGVSVGSSMGRIEMTFAFPLRYGPRDGRKSIQTGIGFNFG